MNPLVSVTESQAGQDVELRFLEDLLNDDCKCESHHKRTKCSEEVTHRIVTCAGDWQVCVNSARDMIYRNRKGNWCAGCKRFTEDCWEIRPI